MALLLDSISTTVSRVPSPVVRDIAPLDTLCAATAAAVPSHATELGTVHPVLAVNEFRNRHFVLLFCCAHLQSPG
jgi:hypothetical protein